MHFVHKNEKTFTIIYYSYQCDAVLWTSSGWLTFLALLLCQCRLAGKSPGIINPSAGSVAPLPFVMAKIPPHQNTLYPPVPPARAMNTRAEKNNKNYQEPKLLPITPQRKRRMLDQENHQENSPPKKKCTKIATPAPTNLPQNPPPRKSHQLCQQRKPPKNIFGTNSQELMEN